MTTSIKVEVSCGPDREVSVGISSEATGENYVLQDGESAEYSLYGGYEIVVQEVTKAVDATEPEETVE